MSLENRLKSLRQKSGLSQEQMAEMVGVTRQAVSKWESGLSKPSVENLIKLAQVLDTSVEDITGQSAKEDQSIEMKYIIGAVMGFLMFVGGMMYAGSFPILVLPGILGSALMAHCITNLV